MNVQDALDLNVGSNVTIKYNNPQSSEVINCIGIVKSIGNHLYETLTGTQYIWVEVKYQPNKHQIKQSVFSSTCLYK